jgi:hypothetical protein
MLNVNLVGFKWMIWIAEMHKMVQNVSLLDNSIWEAKFWREIPQPKSQILVKWPFCLLTVNSLLWTDVFVDGEKQQQIIIKGMGRKREAIWRHKCPFISPRFQDKNYPTHLSFPLNVVSSNTTFEYSTWRYSVLTVHDCTAQLLSTHKSREKGTICLQK